MTFRRVLLAALACLIWTLTTPSPAHAVVPAFGLQNGCFNCCPSQTVADCNNSAHPGVRAPKFWTVCPSPCGTPKQFYHWGKSCGGFFFGSNSINGVGPSCIFLSQTFQFTPGPALLSFCVGPGAVASCNEFHVGFGCCPGEPCCIDFAHDFNATDLHCQLAADASVCGGSFVFNPNTCFTHVVLPVVVPADGVVTLEFSGDQDSSGSFDPTNVRLNANAVPEITPDAAMAPIGLMLGALLVLVDRRRR